jgi:hypothetical protein
MESRVRGLEAPSRISETKEISLRILIGETTATPSAMQKFPWLSQRDEFWFFVWWD